ncbi:MAG TPA: hypothetical protein VF824_18335 [Thermoanaerobaculia bacterium]
MKRLALLLLLALSARAQDAVVVGANADHLRDGEGGGASVLWIRSRDTTTLTAGGAFFSLPSTGWAYATLGGSLRVRPRTIVSAEANLGRGDDARGGFGYLLLRGGVTQELLAKRLYGEAEWLQADVARRQNGIARIGATFLPIAPLTLRTSAYQSVAGDDDTTLVTMRGDYDLGRMIAIAGFSAGHAAPVLLQRVDSDETRVREVFGGVTISGFTIIATAGDDRQRLSISWRMPMGDR